MFALVAAAAITLLVLDIEYNASNVIAVVNPLEKMLTFADAGTSDAANGPGLSGIFLLLIEGIGSVLARYTFVLAFIAASDGVSHLADRARNRRRLAARRKASRDPGA